MEFWQRCEEMGLTFYAFRVVNLSRYLVVSEAFFGVLCLFATQKRHSAQSLYLAQVYAIFALSAKHGLTSGPNGLTLWVDSSKNV